MHSIRGFALPVQSEALPNDQWYGAEFRLGSQMLWVWRVKEAVTAQTPRLQIVPKSSDIEEDYARLKNAG